jgi:peptidyl-prolyl cis-trans isomerase D
MVRAAFATEPRMITSLRRLSETWAAKILFIILVASFSVWGIGDVVRRIGGDVAIARVGGDKIEPAELQAAFQRNLQQANRMLGNADMTPQMRRMVALQSVQQVVTQRAVQQADHKLGVVVPEPALQQAVWDLPAFKNSQGQYDPAIAATVLRNNNMGEAQFRSALRDELAQRQVLGAVAAGAAAPDAMAKEAFAFQREQRVADAVVLPLSAAPEPPAPADKQLERWWANHPDRFSSPEYRRIKAVVLTPETVTKDVDVTEDDLKAAWEQHKDQFDTPERRTAEVVQADDEAVAKQLATQWVEGADWAAMQAAAQKAGASAVELPDATREEFPSPELADAVFAAPEGGITQPIKTPLGWQVARVAKITPAGAKTFADAQPELRKLVAAEKANDLIYDRANRLENLLAGGTSLDDLPGDLGVAAIAGTLDAQGKTKEGEPAPIPGSDALRQALIAAAFQAKQGDPPKLTQAPNGPNGAQSFFALTVESIAPPAPRPLAEVTEQVRADWMANARRHEQEEAAAKLLAAVQAGQSLADAAKAAGLTVTRLPAVGRGGSEDVPKQLVPLLFSLKKPGEATMFETPTGFEVAELAQIIPPDPKADPIGYGQVKDVLSRAIAQDMQELYTVGVRDRANPQITQQAIDLLAKEPE